MSMEIAVLVTFCGRNDAFERFRVILLTLTNNVEQKHANIYNNHIRVNIYE